MTNKEALKIASWLVNDELCREETEYCNKSCVECCREVQKILLKMAQEAEEYPTDKEIQDDMRRTYLGGAEE